MALSLPCRNRALDRLAYSATPERYPTQSDLTATCRRRSTSAPSASNHWICRSAEVLKSRIIGLRTEPRQTPSWCAKAPTRRRKPSSEPTAWETTTISVAITRPEKPIDPAAIGEALSGDSFARVERINRSGRRTATIAVVQLPSIRLLLVARYESAP